MTSTTENVHGVLRLQSETLIVQWSTARETQQVGFVIKTDRVLDPVREAILPLAGLAGAELAWRWVGLLPGPAIVLRAADLRTFESLGGSAGLILKHPAELTLGIRWRDRALAREFAADLEMRLADHALQLAERDDRGEIGGSRSPKVIGK